MADTRRWIWVGGLTINSALLLGTVLVGSAVYRSYAHSWRTLTNPMGYSVELPPEAAVQTDPTTGRLEITSGPGERLVIWPLFGTGRIDDRGGRRLLAGVVRKVWPGVTWGRVDRVAEGTWRLHGEGGPTRRAGVLTCVPTPKGTAAYVYLMAAPAARAAAAEEQFARILASFRLAGRPAASGQPATGPRYIRWQDPREGAFAAEVPEGWRAEGGTLRPSPVLVQAELSVSSPSGDIALLVGDAFPVHAEPSPSLAYAGYGPGDTFRDPMGYPTPIAAYAPGVDYVLRAVVPQRTGGGFRVTRRASRPDLARQLATVGLNRFDAGEAEYVFVRSGRQFRGWVFGVTERVAAPAVTLWHVWRLYLVEAPADHFEDGAAALARLARTFRIDPGWAQRQARLTAEQTRIITELGDATSRTIQAAYENRQDSLDEIHRRGANARREVDEVVDGPTGRKFTVASGSSYYWVDDRGTVVGTDTDTRPGVDFRELTRLP